MEMGLDKLLEAQKSVEELQIELNQKEKDLAVANVEAEKVLAEVTVSAQAAEKVKAEVQLVSAAINRRFHDTYKQALVLARSHVPKILIMYLIYGRSRFLFFCLKGGLVFVFHFLKIVYFVLIF